MSFTLPTLEELQKRINTECPFKDMHLHSLTHTESEQAKAELKTFEQEHEVQLPESFKQVIQTYNFNGFNIGGLWMAGLNDIFIKEMDSQNDIGGIAGPEWQWCREDESLEPEGLVWIGGDPYQFTLDLNTEVIEAYIYGKKIETRIPVAKNFELFVRAIMCGQLIKYAEMPQSLRSFPYEIYATVGVENGNFFWEDCIEHWSKYAYDSSQTYNK